MVSMNGPGGLRRLRRGSGARRHRAGAAATVFALVAVGLVTGAGSSRAAGPDWPTFLGDTGHSSYNASATAITPANAAQLARTWQVLAPAESSGGSRAFQASPTVVDGVAYIGAQTGDFFAVSEATGTVLWTRFLGVEPAVGSKPCGAKAAGFTATAAVAPDPTTGALTVYAYSANGDVYALDAATGATVWSASVYPLSSTADAYYAWSSPLVADGHVYVGVSSFCDSPLVPGGLVSLDQATGAQVARWYTLGQPGPTGLPIGGSVWSSPVLLPNGNIVVTTGNGYNGSGQPLYDESIVTLDPTTLAVLDAWQVPAAQQVSDSDFGASPTVWTATLNGVPTPMVGACNKNGLFYAFLQSDLAAGPVWQTRITVPYPGGDSECGSAAVWNGTSLVIGGGAATTINGVTYPGSVQALDPATGTPLWQTGLPATVVGTPSQDGAGVVAAQTFTGTTLGVYLLNATTGAVLSVLGTKSSVFAQPVFDGSQLLVAAGPSYGLSSFAPPPPPPAGAVRLLTASRVLDTRSGLGAPAGAVGPGASVAVAAAAAPGVPAGVAAVLLDVTTIGATSPGGVSVGADATPPPPVPALTFAAKRTTTTAVLAPVGADGAVALTNDSTGSVQMVADLVGYLTDGPPVTPGTCADLPQTTLLSTATGVGAPAGPLGGGSTDVLGVAGLGAVPSAGVGSVTLTVTASGASTRTGVVAYADAGAAPADPQLVVGPGQTVTQTEVVPVGADGSVDVTNTSSAPVSLTVSLTGYCLGGPATSGGVGLVPPVRVLDTAAGVGVPVGPVAANGRVSLALLGVDGVPSTGVAAVVVDMTATQASAYAQVTAYPDGATHTKTANLIVNPGQTVSNLVVAPVGADGLADLYNGSTGTVNLAADVVGYVAS